MKFGIEYETKVSVEFSEPERAKAIFIDGDWKDLFCELEGLAELAEYIAHFFLYYTDEQEYDPDLECYVLYQEGVGKFVQQPDFTWLAFNTGYGEIRVKIIELNDKVDTTVIG